jgi:hypothetical protein
MNIVIGALLLSYLAISPAIGGDSQDKWMLWDGLILCSQVTTEHPYPPIFRDLNGLGDLMDCCRLGKGARDCHIYDWYENHGSPALIRVARA